MKEILLDFQGYTWDNYFYVIAEKSGILLTFKGGLDSEGAIELDEIVSVDEAIKFSEIYESDKLREIRNKLKVNEMLFFSYAEAKKEQRITVKDALIKRLSGDQRNEIIVIKTNGACALL